jgi:hypothetical protein
MTLAIVNNIAKQIVKINAQVGWLNIRLSISVSGRAFLAHSTFQISTQQSV